MKLFLKNIQKTIHSVVLEYSVELDPNRSPTEQLVTFFIKKAFNSKTFKNIKSVTIRLSDGKIIIKLKNKKPPK